MANNNEKMKLEDLIMFWGFNIFIFGAIGIVLIGILEGITIFILWGGVIMIVGILFLFYIGILDKIRS